MAEIIVDIYKNEKKTLTGDEYRDHFNGDLTHINRVLMYDVYFYKMIYFIEKLQLYKKYVTDIKIDLQKELSNNEGIIK